MRNPLARYSPITVYVVSVCVAAAAMLFVAYQGRLASPGVWEICSFVLVAFLLNQSTTDLHVGASGSTSFVIHLAAAVLFGGFWAGLIAAVSATFSAIVNSAPRIKSVFNIAQRTLSVVLAAFIYRAMGGGLPPAYLVAGGQVDRNAVQVDLALFFLLAAVYLAVNSLSVSGAVALTTGRRLRDVWNLNTRGVLGYDLGASAIALFVAWLYAKVNTLFGFGSFGLLGIVIPIIVVRHIYGLYRQLQETGQELLEVMVKAIEARDPYTSGHSKRVSELSRTIALELGLSTGEVEQVETAALLHDVGKIHEEFAPLLRKESRLTPEETALMQTHAARSAELVGIISKFRGYIHNCVRHHHERWDGAGYPDGVAGKAIPLGARIVLVSDTIDAMTTDRPYRKRLPLDVVINELQKCKATQFDPDIVDVVVTSVAVRRHIVGTGTDAATAAEPGRSERVSWPGGKLWRNRRAYS